MIMFRMFSFGVSFGKARSVVDGLGLG